MDFGNTLGIRLRHAYLKFHRCAQLELAGTGVTADQFVLLSFLAEKDGVMQKTLVELSGSDSSTIAAMTKILEKKELIKRTKDKNDGRAFCISLSEEGRKIQNELSQKVSLLREKLNKSIPENDLQTVLESLEKIERVMSAHLNQN